MLALHWAMNLPKVNTRTGAVLETIMSRIFNKSSAKICLLYACLGLAALQFSGCSSREQRAQNYYDQGMSYLAKTDYVKARLELRNALQLKTEMIEAWRGPAELNEKYQQRA